MEEKLPECLLMILFRFVRGEKWKLIYAATAVLNAEGIW